MRIRNIVLIALIASLFAACDNPVEDDDHGHIEAVGLVLEANGEELVRVENAQTDGEITVEVGEETAHITVHFLNDDGEHLHADEFPEDEYSLGWTIDDTDVAELEQEGRFGMHIHGHSAGETTLKLFLNHGGHADFETPLIPITVTEANGSE